MKYFLDTSAWIEYFEGGKSGKFVSDLILEVNNEIYTSSIVIAEIASKLKRKKSNVEQVLEALKNNALIIELSPEIAKNAGILHAETREKINSFGLMDSLIISLARSIKATLVTKDSHFKSFKEAIIL